jgi:hypothetical protein
VRWLAIDDSHAAAVLDYVMDGATPQPAPAGWRPIETAPPFAFVPEKWFIDGPRYLLAERSRVFIGHYGYTQRGKGRWQDFVGRNVEPTHWMPLPAAPTVKDSLTIPAAPAAPGGEG